jgi:hypothetical protein
MPVIFCLRCHDPVEVTIKQSINKKYCAKCIKERQKEHEEDFKHSIKYKEMLEQKKLLRKQKIIEDMSDGIPTDLITQIIHFICAEEGCLHLQSFHVINISNIPITCKDIMWTIRQ